MGRRTYKDSSGHTLGRQSNVDRHASRAARVLGTRILRTRRGRHLRNDGNRIDPEWNNKSIPYSKHRSASNTCIILFRHVVCHGLFVMEALVPLQEVVDILDPVFARMDTVHTGHGERRHAHLQELVLVQEERFFAIHRHFCWSAGFFSDLFFKSHKGVSLQLC